MVTSFLKLSIFTPYTPFIEAISLLSELLNVQQAALSTFMIVLILLLFFKHAKEQSTEYNTVQGTVKRGGCYRTASRITSYKEPVKVPSDSPRYSSGYCNPLSFK